MHLLENLLHNDLWTPPTKELIYISIGITDEELDRFVDLCCHYDDNPIVPSWGIIHQVDHGLYDLGLIDIVKYDSPLILRITDHGVEIFEDLKRYDPISLIYSCIRLKAWVTAAYFVWVLLSASQLPEFLTHENKKIRDLAAKRLDLLTIYRSAV